MVGVVCWVWFVVGGVVVVLILGVVFFGGVGVLVVGCVGW